MDLVFTAGSSNGTLQCMDVTIIDAFVDPFIDIFDFVIEDNETFIVTVTTLSSIVTLENAVTNVTITSMFTDTLTRKYLY